MTENTNIEVSVVIPVRNGEAWLPRAFDSILQQDFVPKSSLEVSVYNDQSTDGTLEVSRNYAHKFKELGIRFTLTSSTTSDGGGVGYAKNRAILNSSGRFICFLDADDAMTPKRISMQYSAATQLPDNTLIGSKFHRDPINATERYTKWANSLSNDQLYHQRFTTNGPTLIAPTWFCSRKLYEDVGGFKEIPKGFPEDLDFFFRILRMGGKLHRVDVDLMTYQYHPNCESFSVPREEIELMRTREFVRTVIPRWPQFSIWNAGKEGRRFFKSLSPEDRVRVQAFIDIDPKKLSLGSYQIFDDSLRTYVGPRIPIIAPSEAKPPAVICVKLDMTNGELERKIELLYWREGTDFLFFN